MTTTTSTPEFHPFPDTSVVVSMSKYCLRAITDAVDRGFDGREVGGYVVGRILESNRLQIRRHIEQSDDDYRTRSSINLSLDKARSWVKKWRGEGQIESGDLIIGSYHSHPVDDEKPYETDRNASPSTGDRRSALSCMDVFEAEMFVDLIVTEQRSGAWEVTPWVTRRNEDGRPVTDAAMLLVSER